MKWMEKEKPEVYKEEFYLKLNAEELERMLTNTDETSAFLSLHPTKYAEELVKKMEMTGAKAYLVNTGWKI